MTVVITKVTIAVSYIMLCYIFRPAPIGHIFHYQKQGSDKWGTIMRQLSGLTGVMVQCLSRFITLSRCNLPYKNLNRHFFH